MIEIYEECVRLLQMGQHVVIATLFETRGSAPRTAGAKMIIRPDGTIMGTIGGGRLEHDVIGLSRSLFDSRQSAIHAFELTGTDVAGMDMICGGCGGVWLQFLDAGEENDLKVCREAVKLLDCHGKAGKACIVSSIGIGGVRNVRPIGLIVDDKDVTGNLHMDQSVLKKWSGGQTGLSIYTETAAGRRFLIEPIRPDFTVVVFGAGHVSQQVIPLCKNVGFRTIVLDDRGEYANRSRFPQANEVVVIDSFEQWPDIEIGDGSFIVILTRGHIYDKTVLAQALRTRAGYIGMIGSRRKRDKIYQALLEDGVTQQDLARVHSPIGTDIDAETPAELAVSIVGELIKVRAKQGKCR